MSIFKNKENEQKEDNDDFSAGFKVPDIKQAMGGIDETMKRQSALFSEHQAQNEKEEQDEKKGKQKPKRKPKRGGQICICGNSACGIGGFRQLEGGRDED